MSPDRRAKGRAGEDAACAELLEQGFDESIETLVAGDAVPAVQPT